MNWHQREIQSPRLAHRLLKTILHHQGMYAVLGDFEEGFREVAHEKGMIRAHCWYWMLLLQSILPIIYNNLAWSFVMWTNYVKAALRNMRRQKTYALINILGLAIGMACAMIIFRWVAQEQSYDRFHEKHQSIYRVVCKWKHDELASASTPGRLAGAVEEEIPEVLRGVRYMPGSRVIFKHGDKAFYEDGLVSFDPACFDMFSFEFLKGDPAHALTDKRGLVLTESMSKKYFGDEDPIGKDMVWNNWQTYHVTAVIKDVPLNSHIHFDFIDSHALGEQFWQGGYSWQNFNQTTYVELHEDADPAAVAQKITALFTLNKPNQAQYIEKFILQPLTDIHLNAGIRSRSAQVTPRKTVQIFASIAILILIIACINFMNLATARAAGRAREVGLRKVVGSGRWMLILQFLGEAMTYTALALGVAVFIFSQLTKMFQTVFGFELLPVTMNVGLGLSLLGILLITSFAAGSYPAFYLSAFNPVQVFKSHSTCMGKGLKLRRVLVIAQFVISIFLIIMTLGIARQLNFMQNATPGYNGTDLVYVPLKEGIRTNYQVVKQALLESPRIIAVSSRDCMPNMAMNNSSLHWEGKADDQVISVQLASVDYGYFQAMGMDVLQGRSFLEEIPTDASDAFVINESAAAVMNLTDPIGKGLKWGGSSSSRRIIGVVKNAQFNSLRNQTSPRIFRVLSNYNDSGVDLMGVVMIRIQSDGAAGGRQAAIAYINDIWTQFNTDYPFECHFLDDVLDRQYWQEAMTAKLMTFFTVLALTISALGLIGLAAFNAEMRTKELAVRKVLGASMGTLVRLLSVETLHNLLWANLLAWPLAAWMMQRWLQGFATRIDFPLLFFPLALLITLMIALFASGAQAVRAARRQPVKSLRNE
ncbi:ABC transporter permease [bacterium]|nr:ABC transporter permease [bacterium]